jgi:hypothetical protein
MIWKFLYGKHPLLRVPNLLYVDFLNTRNFIPSFYFLGKRGLLAFFGLAA